MARAAVLGGCLWGAGSYRKARAPGKRAAPRGLLAGGALPYLAAMAGPAVPDLPCARTDVALRRVGSEWVLFDPARDRAHVLNPSAAAVWSFCDGAHTPAAIAEALERAAPAPAGGIRRDVDDVLRRFAAEGLLR